MDAKLTLRLNKDIIERAKRFAGSKNTSISRLVEHYLLHLTEQNQTQDISPLVESLTGLIEEPGDDYKRGYGEYLAKKHR